MRVAILFLITCLAGFAGSGQTARYNFYNFSTDNGLPSNQVQHVFQDSYGFLWMATNSGLVRWDGYVLKVYTHEEGDAGSINDNIVYTIYEDSRKMLWIGTIDGLNLYDRQTDKFIKCRLRSGNDRVPVNGIIEDKKSKLWLATSFGLCNYDAKIGTANWITMSKPGADVLFTIAVDGSDNIWAGTYNSGVVKYEQDKGRSLWFDPVPEKKGAKNRVNALLTTTDGQIWIANEADGLSIMDSSGKLVTRHRHFFGDQQANDNSVTALYEDKNGTIWIGVQGQVLYYKLRGTSDIRPIDYGAQNNDNSRPVSIASITEDRFGNTWFASLSGGL